MRQQAETRLSSPLMLRFDPYALARSVNFVNRVHRTRKQLPFQGLGGRSGPRRAGATTIHARKGKFYVCIGKYARHTRTAISPYEFTNWRPLTAHRHGILPKQDFA